MEAKIEGVNIHKQIFATDSRLNYCFIKEDELKDEQRGTRRDRRLYLWFR